MTQIHMSYLQLQSDFETKRKASFDPNARQTDGEDSSAGGDDSSGCTKNFDAKGVSCPWTA